MYRELYGEIHWCEGLKIRVKFEISLCHYLRIGMKVRFLKWPHPPPFKTTTFTPLPTPWISTLGKWFESLWLFLCSQFNPHQATLKKSVFSGQSRKKFDNNNRKERGDFWNWGAKLCRVESAVSPNTNSYPKEKKTKIIFTSEYFEVLSDWKDVFQISDEYSCSWMGNHTP